jgi:hypothetical protein
VLNKLEIAKARTTSVNILTQLAQDRDWSVVRAVARNSNTPAGVLARLAKHESQQVRKEVACHPNTPIAILEQLATDLKFSVRKEVGCNRHTPVNVLAKLLEDPEADLDLVKEIASCHDLPAAVLEKLMADRPNWSKRYGDCATWFYLTPIIARNPNTPAALLAQLAEEEDYRLRYAVAQNPSAPTAVLAQLAEDGVDVAKNPNAPLQIRADMQAAKDLHSNMHRLDELAQSRFSTIREAVAEHPLTPAAILEQLATDWNEDVRKAVARRPDTPKSILERLANDARCGINLFRNPQLQADIQAAKSADTDISRLVELFQSPFPFIRKAVAANPATPATILKQWAADENSDRS